MKIIGFLTLFLVGFGLACDRGTNIRREQVKVEPAGIAEIVFDTTVYDLGTVKEGEQVIAWFNYRNEGNGPLVIKDIKAGCGCTVPEWSRLPLDPGGKESIKIVFNSRGKVGIQVIPITVLSNSTHSREELELKSVVKRIY